MEGPASDPAAPSAGEQQPERVYTLPGLDGEWTLQQLVEMEVQRDPRMSQVRRSALPPEFWDARRRARNHSRLQRNYVRRKRRGEALRQEEAELLSGMGEAEQAEYEAAREAEREAAKAAAAAQREAVAAAMEGGLRVVVDCSLSSAPPPSSNGSDGRAAAGQSGGASDREVRSLCKQLELCAAANKRAARPVSLQFASFTGRVQQFALEGMHADRWPAARGHEAPLAQLFPADQLVVLSPDAAEPVDSLEPNKVYVIGGLVDRTVQKGASLKLAQRCGARAVRLPIAEHLGPLSKGKGVLNVNDVFTALLAVHGGQGWREALEAAIPQRIRQGARQGQAALAGEAAAATAAALAGQETAAPTAVAAQHDAVAAQGSNQQPAAATEGLGSVEVRQALPDPSADQQQQEHVDKKQQEQQEQQAAAHPVTDGQQATAMAG